MWDEHSPVSGVCFGVPWRTADHQRDRKARTQGVAKPCFGQGSDSLLWHQQRSEMCCQHPKNCPWRTCTSDSGNSISRIMSGWSSNHGELDLYITPAQAPSPQGAIQTSGVSSIVVLSTAGIMAGEAKRHGPSVQKPFVLCFHQSSFLSNIPQQN